MSDVEFLSARDLARQLSNKLGQATSEAFIASAFVTVGGYNWLNERAKHLDNRSLIVRFTLTYILNGSSDLQAIDSAIKDGWQVFVDQSLHSKVFIIDDKSVLLGSSNLTSRGLGLATRFQNEANVIFESTSTPKKIKSHLMQDAVAITNNLLEQLKSHMSDIKKSDAITSEDVQWPEELIPKPREISDLLSSDFPDLPPEKIGKAPSSFFSDSVGDSISDTFLNSKAYRWLISKLASADTKYTNFGWLSSVVQDALIDVPPATRVQAKEITALLFTYVDMFSEEIEITHYRHTRGMSLVETI